ncbi:MAG: aminotransferase class V-fold PLP-dependent enzyme, partial [Anaerolineales bacterium]|nr:aminotransferase class V-fold PLP-dependent enzyme [Anaerolineales bacterium]
QIPNQPDGTLRLEDIRSAIRPDDAHHPITRLVALENTHNRCGGVVLGAAYTRAVGELAHERGLQVHMDGARIFNAAVSLGIPAKVLLEGVDSVTFCLSKALCAPVGSVLCGSREFIGKAHRIRKQLGGGMRQAGILAAAGIVALESMVERLAEDHRRAKVLAAGLAGIPGLTLEPGTPYTNMIFAGLEESAALTSRQVVEKLAERGVKIGIAGKNRFRLVTHYWIDDEAVELAAQHFRAVLML